MQCYAGHRLPQSEYPTGSRIAHTYRFVGKALVLRDVRANIIVDFIPNALL